MTTTCPTCKEPIHVAPSKRIQVCKNCLSIERTGLSLKDIARQKQKVWAEKSRLKAMERQKQKPPKTYTIPARSVNGAKREREISKTKTEMKRDALDGSFVECSGCGNFFDVIDGSHKVQLSKSSELASKPDNIRLLCRGCHDKWGEGSVTEMLELKCLAEDLKYLFENDAERFWKIFYRLIDEYNLSPTPALERLIYKLERLETQ